MNIDPDFIDSPNSTDDEAVENDALAAGALPPRERTKLDSASAILIDLIRQSQDALIVRDLTGTIHDMNPAAEALYGYSLAEARGNSVYDLFANQLDAGRAYYEATLVRDGQWAGEIVQRRKDGSEVIVSSRQTLRRGAEGEPDVVLASNRDITVQRRAVRRLQRLFDSHVVGVIYWNLDSGKITDANDTFLKMVGYTRDDLIAGQLDFRAMTPPEWTERNERGVEALRRDGSAPTYEKEYFRKDGSRLPILIGGTRFEESSAEGFSFILDISDRKRQEQWFQERDARERARLTEIFLRAPAFMSILVGPNHICEIANPPYFQLLGHRDIIGKSVAEALPEVVEQGYIELLDRVYQTGEAFVGNARSILLQFEPGGALEQRFLDFTYQPLFDDNGAVWGILVHGIDQTERNRLERETQRLLHEERLRIEREALLNRIRAVVRSTSEPEGILRAAVSTLGQGLNADRCYFVRYNPTRDSGLISPEWSRPEAGLAPIAGVSRQMSAYAVNDAAFRAGRTQTIDDTIKFAPDRSSALIALDIRALIRVPIEIGDQMTAIGVVATAPRHWTADEVNLVEDAAALVRSALEWAYIQQREHNIAQQLQEALQPPVPSCIPGLALADHYSAALGEAEVGGDFHDVFTLNHGRYGLVVADLAGKGLNAARQVSLVRNQLRYALYTADLNQADALAQAMNTLNQVLATNDLLMGFATLFVAVWDVDRCTLTYVNAGQEPALIWRAGTDRVEMLLPTGPVMGGYEGGIFTETTVQLDVGDVWTAFSDGMTEIGPTRKELLGIEGVVPLFAASCRDGAADRAGTPGLADPQTVLARLVAGVTSFSRGTGMRDDLCALVGVRCDAAPMSQRHTSAADSDPAMGTPRGDRQGVPID